MSVGNLETLLSYLCLFSIIANVTQSSQGNCTESLNCGKTQRDYYSFVIRWPFWLRGVQSEDCGLSGFELSCDNSHTTVLNLKNVPIQLRVADIDYKSHEIQVDIPGYFESVLVGQELEFINLLEESSLFKIISGFSHFTLLNCSRQPDVDDELKEISNLIPWYKIENFEGRCVNDNDPNYKTCAIRADSLIEDNSQVVNCTKLYDYNAPVHPLNPSNLMSPFQLTWTIPYCNYCEQQQMGCKFKENATEYYEPECFNITSIQNISRSIHKRGTKPALIAGLTTGAFIIVLCVVIGTSLVTRNLNKREREDQLRIEKFLEDYLAFKPSRYSYTDIKKITDKFLNKLGEGAYGAVFKGKLSNEIYVAVKILSNTKGAGKEFINEVATIGQIHHINVVRLVGYCADGYRRALVYEFLPKGSLEKYVSPRYVDIANRSLSWEKFHGIALGIAKGIEYLHQGCHKTILHFDIKPHNILLDQNFTPKISDFGLAKLCSEDESVVSMTTARGTIGYIAPEVLSRNFGNVSFKSDVYSFGMLVLEMVGGRKITDIKEETAGDIYYPEWIYNLLEGGEDLRIRIEEHEDSTIAKKLAIVGLWCIQWHPVSRPNMKAVVQMLEGTKELKMPPNPFATNSEMRKRPMALELEVIAE